MQIRNTNDGMIDIGKAPVVDASGSPSSPPCQSKATGLVVLFEGIIWGAFALFVMFVKPLFLCRHFIVTEQYSLAILIVLSLGAFLMSLGKDIVRRKLSKHSFILFVVWMIIAITISVMFWNETLL